MVDNKRQYFVIMNTHSTPYVSVGHPVILIVEDEFLVRLMLGEILREAGFAVIEASSGDEAMTIISQNCPDIIVTDVRMPGSIDGLQLMEKVRETNSKLPIILTSAHLMHVDDLTNGPTRFIPKPYEFDTVVQLIEYELEQR